MSTLVHLATTQLATLPEVIALVVTDEAGAVLASSGGIDGEAIGAVHVVTMQALTRCGNALGLGTLRRLAITGTLRACSISICDGEVLGAYLDPARPIAAFEHKLETALQR